MELSNLLSKLKTDTYNGIPSDSFNIFSILGIETKEVLICRLIGALLEPDGRHGIGRHGMGNKPLSLFAEKCLGKSFSEAELENSRVELEDQIEGKRRVDIVIYTREAEEAETEKCYPIEVKIYAGDQNAQLSDYLNYYRSKPGTEVDKIYYLTPTGWAPAEKSRKDLELGKDVECLSFVNNKNAIGNISDWLQALLDICEVDETSIILKQFKEAIEAMSNNDEFINEFKVALNLDKFKETGEFEETGELRAALNIINNCDTLKKEIQRCYLKSLLDFDGKSYSTEDCDGVSAPFKGRHCLLKIVDQDNNDIAWICVEKNLYLVAREDKFKEKHSSSLNLMEENEYRYSYLYITPDGGVKRFALGELNKFPKGKIRLSEYLDI